MLRSYLLGLLPLVAAVQLPILPSPGDAFSAVDSYLHQHQDASTVLSPGNGISLSSVPGDDHIVLTSARHPNHQMKIKAHDGWCDPAVKSYTGYIDVGNEKDLFFYFFESRSNPSEDPVVMWINGGPGCSSSLGLFMELGPCTVNEDAKSINDTKVNPFAWNDKANVFFLDEPIGVGFSEGEHGQSIATTEAAAIDVQAFIHIFFEAFKEFEGRPFHMAGESYGGRYLPVFASAVYDGNKALIADGQAPINLQSVMIGNGMTDTFKMTEAYATYQCTIHGGLNTTLASIEQCVSFSEAIPRCHKMLQQNCIDTHDYASCGMAELYCQQMLVQPFHALNLNPYDVSKQCSPEFLASSLCYSDTDKIRHYLDLPEVREMLGVHDHRGNFSSCDKGVGSAFRLAMDSTGQTWLYVAGLLERGIKVLVYVGTYDWICNHIGNQMWTESLMWSGKEGYNAESLAEWKVDGKVAGSFKGFGPLTHLKITGAGHMVPLDKPKEALSMLNYWLDSVSFSESN